MASNVDRLDHFKDLLSVNETLSGKRNSRF